MFLFCYRLPRIAQKCTATTTIVVLYTLYKFKLCRRHASWQINGDSWIIIGLATGFGNWNLSSFHKVVPKFFIPSIQNRIHFFFFQGGIRGFGVKSILQTLECGVKRMEYSILRQVLSAFEIDSTSVDTNSVPRHILKESFLDCGVKFVKT